MEEAGPVAAFLACKLRDTCHPPPAPAMSGHSDSAHMAGMTSSARMYQASIATVSNSGARKTIVFPLGSNALPYLLPLTDVTIRLRSDEFFMAATSLGEVCYFRELSDATNWARNSAPNAIVILSPSTDSNGVTDLIVVSLHERAVPVSS
jgi:hypothetical protein